MADRREQRAGWSLRARLAAWMLATAVVSLVVFAVTAYLLVWLEEKDELARDEPPDSPADIAAETLEEMLAAMALAAPVALLVSIGGAVIVSRRTLAPVRAVAAAADDMSARDLNRRLPPPRAPELAELTASLNGLFARLEAGFGALERYAGAASHELRTPLAVLASELEVALRRERAPEEWARVAGAALDEVRRLTAIVEALLAWSRLDARPPGADGPADVGEAVARAVGLIAAAAAAAGVTVDVADDGGGAVFATAAGEEAVSIAVSNLLANAVRYTPAGGAVRVTLGREGAGVVRIDVDDAGPGVAEAEREAIFEPFRRGAAARGDEDAGLGLGLATVKRVAEHSGGSVVVGASPLGGARFTLRLPAARG